jgi:hypothetical protein
LRFEVLRGRIAVVEARPLLRSTGKVVVFGLAMIHSAGWGKKQLWTWSFSSRDGVEV